MNLSEYRASSSERQRTEDLVGLMPASGNVALDIGARDGHFSLLMADRFNKVIALDLTKPLISNPKVFCVEGNAESLEFADNFFDFVFCAEVFEHIPFPILAYVCNEIERVSNDKILIGVPYCQDIRFGRTTCYSCMGKNPPWGHVNSFDEGRLLKLFSNCSVLSISYVGISTEQTNWLSCLLMDLAGNPYGTYTQEEPCIHCGHALVFPPERNLIQKLFTKLAFWSQSLTAGFNRPRANWVHVLLSKNQIPDPK